MRYCIYCHERHVEDTEDWVNPCAPIGNRIVSVEDTAKELVRIIYKNLKTPEERKMLCESLSKSMFYGRRR